MWIVYSSSIVPLGMNKSINFCVSITCAILLNFAHIMLCIRLSEKFCKLCRAFSTQAAPGGLVMTLPGCLAFQMWCTCKSGPTKHWHIYVQCNITFSSNKTFTCFSNTMCTLIGIHLPYLSQYLSSNIHPYLGNLPYVPTFVGSRAYKSNSGKIFPQYFLHCSLTTFWFSKFCNVFVVFKLFVPTCVIINNKCKL